MQMLQKIKTQKFVLFACQLHHRIIISTKRFSEKQSLEWKAPLSESNTIAIDSDKFTHFGFLKQLYRL